MTEPITQQPANNPLGHLWQLMADEHDLLLLNTEEGDIIQAVLEDIMPRIVNRSEDEIRKEFSMRRKV